MGSHAERTMQPDHYYTNTTNHQCYSTKTELTKQLKLSLDTIDQHTRITGTKALLEILQPKIHVEGG